MPSFDPEKILRALAKHKVRYVLIGASAARLQGFPCVTADADIAPALDAANLTQLSRVLKDLNARVYTEAVPEGLPLSFNGASLARAKLEFWVLSTARSRAIYFSRRASPVRQATAAP